jgi:hypothetical protein
MAWGTIPSRQHAGRCSFANAINGEATHEEGYLINLSKSIIASAVGTLSEVEAWFTSLLARAATSLNSLSDFLLLKGAFVL